MHRHVGKGPHKHTLIKDGWLVIPYEIMRRPSVVIGEGGSGKTETLLKIAHLATTVYGYTVIYFDAKGDDDLALRFVATMRKAGKQRIGLFPIMPYNGWRGDARALHSRLMAIENYSEPYYKNMAKLMLDLALYAPGQPLKNSKDLLHNLALEQLKIAYRGREEQRELERIKAEDANGVYNRYRAFFRALHGKLDSGFTFDQADATYIKLDTVAFADEASGIGRYLLEDLAHYITVRKPHEKRVLIIIDEVSALAIDSIVNLSERFRSFNAPIMLACQSEEGLAKTLDERSRILKASHMLILHTCNAPEKLIVRAGQHKEVNARWSMRGEEGTDYATLSLEDTSLIPPDEARRLNVGECFVIAQGSAYKARVAAVQNDPVSLADARAYIELLARSTRSTPITKKPEPVVQDTPATKNDQPSSEQDVL